jgi:hypothetical protein
MNVTMGHRDGRRLGWTPFAWLVYLAFFLAPLVVGHPTTREVVWCLVAVAAFLPLYFAGFRSVRHGSQLLLIAWAIHGIGLATVRPARASSSTGPRSSGSPAFHRWPHACSP